MRLADNGVMTKLLAALLFGLALVGCGADEASISAVTVAGANKSCVKSQGSTLFEYNHVTFASGEIFVSCAISDSASTYSNSDIYHSTQNGASTGACLLTYDIDAASAGFWRFENTSDAVSITYSDSGSGSNGSTISVAASDCTTN